MITKLSGSVEFNFHRAQLTQDLVPIIYTNPLLGMSYGIDDRQKAVFLGVGAGIASYWLFISATSGEPGRWTRFSPLHLYSWGTYIPLS